MKTTDVAVVILFDGERMLINLRPQQGYFGGWWEWPGGKKSADETFEHCARRELLEEIGLEAGELAEYDRRILKHPDREVNVVFFIGKLKQGSVAKPDALVHRWVLPHEVLEYKFLEGSTPVLKRILEMAPKPA